MEEVERLLDVIQSEIQRVVDANLLGLYLTGSLVTGDFDLDVSDVDLLAVTSAPLTPDEIERLGEMHRALARQEAHWDNRIEVAYVPLEALRTYKTSRSTIAVTSPGEPFHTKDAGIDWLINWYVVREKGKALLGPPPTTIIEAISQAELVEAARQGAISWRERIKETWHRNSQVYATLTLCRALYTVRTGGYASKRHAALWVATELPDWAPLIQSTLRSWREVWYNDRVDHRATLAATIQFVNFVIDLIEKPHSRST